MFGVENKNSRELETQVQVAIGNLTVDAGGLKTGIGHSRYPVWNYYKAVDVKLVEELIFESDMRVSLRTGKESKIQEIGSFAVPVHSIAKRSKKP